MTWTAPMTFTANQILTAAQMNTFLRDNMLESEMAKAKTNTGYIVASAKNSIVERVPGYATVETAESTQSTDYTDLATIGPTVEVDTGTQAFVCIAAALETDTTNGQARMNFDISGDTSRSPSDETALVIDGIAANDRIRCAQYDLVQNLTPGTNKFEMKYAASRVSPATAMFRSRYLIVFPL